MPKGIHDSSSDMSLVLGHEIQLRVHASKGVDVRQYLSAAKGLMINTVESASFGGLPSYQSKTELPDGTIIEARLSHGIQSVDIYPTEPEPVEIIDALFLLQPKPGYPQVAVYESSSSPDGIRMISAELLLSGNIYSQAHEPKRSIMFSLCRNNPSENYLEGSLFSEHGGNGIYSNGQTVINMNGTALGAAVVQDEMFVFVEDTGAAINFWSHPVISVPISSDAAFIVPLISIADCILVHTIITVTYSGEIPTTDPVGYTPCTFNTEGTKAVLSSLLGVIENNTHIPTNYKYRYVSTCEQDVYELNLYVTSGVLFINSTRDAKSYRKTISEVTENNYTFTQNIPDVIFGSAIDGAGTIVNATFNGRAQERPGYQANSTDPKVEETIYSFKINTITYDKELSVNRSNSASGGANTILNKYHVYMPKQFSLREDISITEVYRRPYIVITFFDTVVYNNYDGDMYLTFDTASGSVDVPGLPMWKNNFNDKTDSNSYNTKDEPDSGLYSPPFDTDTHYQTPGVPARAIDFHGDPDRNGNSLPNTRVRMCAHPYGYAMYSTTNYYMLERQSEVDLATATATVVLGLFNPNGSKFIDLLAMYNAFLVSSGSALPPIPSTGIAATITERDYMYKYGVVNKIPIT